MSHGQVLTAGQLNAWNEYRQRCMREYMGESRLHHILLILNPNQNRYRNRNVNWNSWKDLQYLITALRANNSQAYVQQQLTGQQQVQAQEMLYVRDTFLRLLRSGATQSSSSNIPMKFQGIEYDVFYEVAAALEITGTTRWKNINWYCVTAPLKFEFFKEVDRAKTWFRQRLQRDAAAGELPGQREFAESSLPGLLQDMAERVADRQIQLADMQTKLEQQIENLAQERRDLEQAKWQLQYEWNRLGLAKADLATESRNVEALCRRLNTFVPGPNSFLGGEQQQAQTRQSLERSSGTSASPLVPASPWNLSRADTRNSQPPLNSTFSNTTGGISTVPGISAPFSNGFRPDVNSEQSPNVAVDHLRNFFWR